MNVELLLQTALKYEGYPGICSSKNPGRGDDPTGFDCSGFIVYVLREIGFPLDKSIRSASHFFDKVGILIHEEYAVHGDLIFFSRRGLHPTHMGILTGPHHYISSPGTTDSKVCVREIPRGPIKPREGSIYSHNPIGFKRLAVPRGRWQQILC